MVLCTECWVLEAGRRLVMTTNPSGFAATRTEGDGLDPTTERTAVAGVVEKPGVVRAAVFTMFVVTQLPLRSWTADSGTSVDPHGPEFSIDISQYHCGAQAAPRRVVLPFGPHLDILVLVKRTLGSSAPCLDREGDCFRTRVSRLRKERRHKNDNLHRLR